MRSKFILWLLFLYLMTETPLAAHSSDVELSTSIVILRGPPGVGKTAVSLVLREKLSPAARVSVDVLRYMVSPRTFSPKLLRAIKLNTGRIASSFAEEGISSLIESTFADHEVVEELCSIIQSYGFTPHVFTLVADEETVRRQNLQRELYYQTDQERVHHLYQNYNWNVGKKIYIQDKEIEEVAADILIHLETFKKIKRSIPVKHEDTSRYLLFLRHGESPSDPNIFLSDYKKPLSPKGKKQAEQIAEVIKKFNPDSIYCSPFLRTKMTGELACKNLKQPMHMVEGLVERAFPMLYGMTRNEIASAFSQKLVSDLCHRSDDVLIPGSETLEEAQQRVVKEIESILKSSARRILVISHGGPHSWLCCHYANLDLSKIRLFALKEGHLSLFQFSKERCFEKFVSLNSLQPPFPFLTEKVE